MMTSLLGAGRHRLWGAGAHRVAELWIQAIGQLGDARCDLVKVHRLLAAISLEDKHRGVAARPGHSTAAHSLQRIVHSFAAAALLLK
jgi:hypothetical protein